MKRPTKAELEVENEQLREMNLELTRTLDNIDSSLVSFVTRKVHERDRLNRFRRRNKKLKLCRECVQPAVEGRSRCQKHIDYQRDYKAQ